MQYKILLADDNNFYCSLVTFLVAVHTPYKVRVVKTGGHAIEAAQSCVPLLFLLDYQLPDMTGLQLYDQLHQLPGCEHVPALLITANLPNPQIEMMLAARKIWGISKPFTREVFLQAIRLLVIQPERL